mmetsp:Transcript_55679/g.120292  ORF Transcript_55679/g.120292 Transcript_55679/m.120292 type:complete len:303 (-) Transcript_55679:392-1300(-)|eukprot:CAMPEP_0170577384 /NCGR_PEP_ID=MMETSP0224-20130122/4898_1 /TAXON_ID=285029 /ORGANISM="Togula jolla, Strain CCCM 725" /LENGTH=302 /DNA_ID=CAMNT_0010900291 /DNA_START=34 /DNA_END=942 /DNA_ORIENTATION=+
MAIARASLWLPPLLALHHPCTLVSADAGVQLHYTGAEQCNADGCRGAPPGSRFGTEASSEQKVPVGGCRPSGKDNLGLSCLDVAERSWKSKRWFNSWAFDESTLMNMGALVRSGKFVRLENALSEEAAEALHAELWHSTTWAREVNAEPQIQFARHINICEKTQSCPPVLDAFQRLLRTDLQFWSQFCRPELNGWNASGSATWYRSGDFLSPHTDQVDQRALAFVLGLTKNWNASWGGSLWWLRERPQEFPPTFNTLYLFLPGDDSQHMVSTAIHDSDLERRLSISGWFMSPAKTLRKAMDV